MNVGLVGELGGVSLSHFKNEKSLIFATADLSLLSVQLKMGNLY